MQKAPGGAFTSTKKQSAFDFAAHRSTIKKSTTPATSSPQQSPSQYTPDTSSKKSNLKKSNASKESNASKASSKKSDRSSGGQKRKSSGISDNRILGKNATINEKYEIYNSASREASRDR